MYNSGETFSNSASVFSNQLINMYTKNLGNWAYVIIGIAAFTTMFSTTLTTLDASPRAMAKTTELLFKKSSIFNYTFWIALLTIGTLFIFFFFASEMGLLIKIATILSFLTAPFYAIINYKLISSKHTPKEWQPSKKMHVLSILGIVFLIGFSIWFLIFLRSFNRILCIFAIHFKNMNSETASNILPGERQAKPKWLRVKFPTGKKYTELRGLVDKYKLNTICTSGSCPNMGECWGEGTATFMILGNICTRSCGFCGVKTGRPETVDWDEPEKVARSIKIMNIKHAVLTSVDRDDLKDMGSIMWAETVKAFEE